jgi:hypothetical protein
MKTAKSEAKHNSLLGTILTWQNEESKFKKLPKNLYTKIQIESMLRALFLICKLSDLNYGNIIEHLIKISEPVKLNKSPPQPNCHIFTN